MFPNSAPAAIAIRKPSPRHEGVPSGAITTIRTDHAMWKLVGFADVAHLAEGNRSADRTA